MSRGNVTARMHLRVPDSPLDHAWLVGLHNDPLVLHNLTNPQPIDLPGHLDWWTRICADPNEQRLLFEVNGERVGFTKFYGIDRANKCCTLGADIHKDYRGLGLAKPMWTMMLDVCFGPAMHLHRVHLTTAEYNTIGCRLYAGLGFKEEGRLEQSLYRNGQYRDQFCMRLLEQEWRVPIL